jgi:hypothetical protein
MTRTITAMTRHKGVLAVAAAVAVFAAAPQRPARAQGTPDCTDSTMFPNPIYILGVSEVQPILGALAAAVSTPAMPRTLVFQATDPCTAIMGWSRNAIGGTATAYSSAGTSSTCVFGTMTYGVASFGVSDLFPSTCAMTVASPYAGFIGPVIVDELVVPSGSTSDAISAKAAYFVFGFGASGQVTPWTDPTQVLIRAPTTGILQRLSVAIHVPPAKWKGSAAMSSGSLVNTLSNIPTPMSALGILGAGPADTNRSVLKPLAYREYLMTDNVEQQCAYTPDSSAMTTDKRNVRDGHYPLWGYLHVYTQLDASGTTPIDSRATLFIGALTGSAQSTSVLTAEISAGMVPACAMQVTRSDEMAPFASYAAPQSCACFFETKVAGGTAPAGCAVCAQDSDCTGGKHCSYGYCEL